MTHMKKSVLSSLVAVISLTGCWSDDTEPPVTGDNAFAPGSGIVSYAGYAPLASRPVKIHYSIPESGDIATMPVLFVLPGLERNAADYLASWRGASSSRRFMVFVLEFPSATYSTSQYIEGGMFDNGIAVDRRDWTFSIIEPLFDFIKENTGSKAVEYDMWGHSAGGQFVHRYVTFMPDARIDRAVCANAGWYTLPDPAVEYPYGLMNSGMDDSETLRHLFGTELIVQLGTTDTGRDGLNTTPGAEAQGANRFERGNFYFTCGETVAARGNYRFRWTRQEVRGVGHDQAAMAADAAVMLY